MKKDFRSIIFIDCDSNFRGRFDKKIHFKSLFTEYDKIFKSAFDKREREKFKCLHEFDSK